MEVIEQQIFTEVMPSSRNMHRIFKEESSEDPISEDYMIDLQPNFQRNGSQSGLQNDMEMEETSDLSTSPSRTSDSPPYPYTADTPEVEIDPESLHALSSLSSDCLDTGSSPIGIGNGILSPNEIGLDNMDRIRLGKLQRPNSYTPEQRNLLLKYFDEYKMNSTHRKNMQLIEQCAQELIIPVPKVKNWIGAEAVRRKKKLGLLPKAKIYQTNMHPTQLNNIALTPNKTVRRQRSTPVPKPVTTPTGYQLVYTTPDKVMAEANGNDFAKYAMKQFSTAEIKPIATPVFAKATHGVNPAIGQFEMGLEDSNCLPNAPTVIKQTQRLVNYRLDVDDPQQMLTAIQELYQYLEHQGFEGYGVLVNTKQIQTHLVSTHKGLSYHQNQVRSGKPLENPFMGYIFSDNENSEKLPTPAASPDNTVENGMRRKVEIEFALKYKNCTGKTDIPYDSPSELDVMIAGMPPSIPFQAPNLYTRQQLELLVAALPHILFYKCKADLDDDSPVKAELTEGMCSINLIPTALLPNLSNGHIIQPIFQ